MGDQVLGKAVLELETDGSAMYKGLDDAKKKAESAGKDIANAIDKGGRRAAVGLAAMAAGAVAALNGTVQLGKGLREVNTMFGLTGAAAEKSFAELQKGTRDLSREVGVAQTTITKGLYQAISAGVPRENVFEFLKVASQASIAGVTDVETTVDGLTSIINAFGLKASDAQAVADSMFTTVKGGKTTFADLSAAIFNVAPAAAAAGVSFQEVNAAVATLTSSGVPTAVATTQIRQALVGLQRPSEDLDKIFQKVGFTNAQAALQSKGLAFALGTVKDAAGGDAGKLQTLLGSVEAVSAAQIIAGTGAKKMAEQLDAQKNSAGSATQAFKEMDESDARRLERSKIAIQNLALSLSEALTPAIETFANIVQAVTGYLDDHEHETRLVIAALAVLLGTIVAANAAMKIYNGFQTAVKVANALWTASQWLLNASLASTNAELATMNTRLNLLKGLGRITVTIAVVKTIVDKITGSNWFADSTANDGLPINPATGKHYTTNEMVVDPKTGLLVPPPNPEAPPGAVGPVGPPAGSTATTTRTKTTRSTAGYGSSAGGSGGGSSSDSALGESDPIQARAEAQRIVDALMAKVKLAQQYIDEQRVQTLDVLSTRLQFNSGAGFNQMGPMSGFDAGSIAAQKAKAEQDAAAAKAWQESVEKSAEDTTSRMQEGIKAAIDAADRVLEQRRSDFAGRFGKLGEAGLKAFDAETSRMQDNLAASLRDTLALVESQRASLTDDERAYQAFQQSRADEARRTARAQAEAITDPVERAARLRELDLDDQERALAAAADASRAARDDQARKAAAGAQSDYDQKRLALEAERALGREHYQTQLAELTTYLSTRETDVADANKRITKLFEDFGIDPSFKQAGIDAGEGFATGLREKAAEALAALGVLTSTPAAPDLSTAAGALAAAFPNWHAFADGGIVTRPTYGVFGEAVPEAIIPLDKLNGLGGPDRIVLELDGRVITEVVRNQLGRFQQSNVSTGIV